ncbi:MAG TPA: cytochrome c-type biogenesis protein [Hyphomicrobiales bacterium]|nr:cytochrome c-type biogenesis protein [Hyphomicrobiales bacterium]
MTGWLVTLSLVAVSPAFAIDPDEILPNPRQEAQARALFGEFRCLVCQSQSIETSEAPLAKDFRNLVRQQVVAGKSPAEIRAFLVSRYGDFILMKPPLDAETVLLWATPALIVVLGGGLAGWALLRRRTEPSAPAPLGDDERARLAALLDE